MGYILSYNPFCSDFNHMYPIQQILYCFSGCYYFDSKQFLFIRAFRKQRVRAKALHTTKYLRQPDVGDLSTKPYTQTTVKICQMTSVGA